MLNVRAPNSYFIEYFKLKLFSLKSGMAKKASSWLVGRQRTCDPKFEGLNPGENVLKSKMTHPITIKNVLAL